MSYLLYYLNMDEINKKATSDEDLVALPRFSREQTQAEMQKSLKHESYVLIQILPMVLSL